MAPKIKRRFKRRSGQPAPKRGPKVFRTFQRGQFQRFDADTAYGLTQHQGWPKHKQDILDILSYVERFIALDDRIICFDPITTPPQPDAPLPQLLADALGALAGTSPLGEQLNLAISDAQAASLWELIQTRAQELASSDEHPNFDHLATLEAWPLFEALTVLVAEGTTYTKGFLGRELNFSVEAQASWLKGFELFFVSFLQVLTTDLRSLWWLVRQPLKQGGFSGMCRHYSLLLQSFWEIATRVTQRHPDTHVVTISGTHQFLLQFDHAWTWFVDIPTGRIVPVDLTGADWLYDRKQADSIFNRGFDAQHFNNVSGLIQTLLSAAAPGRLDPERVMPLLTQLLRPEATYGQALLLNMTRHNTCPSSARARILSFLERQENLRPWLDTIATQHESAQLNMARAAMESAGAYELLLDRLGL